jgi:hypothetical protein
VTFCCLFANYSSRNFLSIRRIAVYDVLVPQRAVTADAGGVAERDHSRRWNCRATVPLTLHVRQRSVAISSTSWRAATAGRWTALRHD